MKKFKISVIQIGICLFLMPSIGLWAQSPEITEGEIYDFMNEVLIDVAKHPRLFYLEEKVRGNKVYNNQPDRIFTDKIRKLDTKLLDSLLTEDDWRFMKDQAENLKFKRWNEKSLHTSGTEILPASSSRKNRLYYKDRLHLASSLPFFSLDKKTVIFFICKQEETEGWESIMLYQKRAEEWHLVTSKISMWHLQE